MRTSTPTPRPAPREAVAWLGAVRGGKHRSRRTCQRGHTRIGLRYLALALVLAALAVMLGPWGVIAGWMAASVALVACAYLFAGVAVFRKSRGRLHLAARMLLAPYLWGLRASRRHYARKVAMGWSRINDALLVGRRTTAAEAESLVREGVVAVVDLTPEHDEREAFLRLPYLNLQVLDLTPPSVAQCALAVDFIREHAGRGTVYVHCGLGYSRTAVVAAAYVLATDGGTTVEQACATVRRLHPVAKFRPAELRVLEEFRTAQRDRASPGPPTPDASAPATP